MNDPSLAEDLSTICDFEIVLRNVLPWRQQVTQVTEHYGSPWPSIDPKLLDDTLSHVEQLVSAVAALRDELNARNNPEARLGRVTH